jgi:hypothetical protein
MDERRLTKNIYEADLVMLEREDQSEHFLTKLGKFWRRARSRVPESERV